MARKSTPLVRRARESEVTAVGFVTPQLKFARNDDDWYNQWR